MNAQEKFEHLVINFFKPIFKENGFRIPALNFYKDCGEFRKIVQIQKSQFNSKTDLKFTMNIGIFDKLINEKISRFGIIKTPKPHDCALAKRIGKLLPEKLDKWYEINSKTSLEKLQLELESDLNNYLFPYLNKFEIIENVVSEYKEEKDPFIISKPIDLYYAIHQLNNGEKEKAEPIVISYFLKWKGNQYWEEKITELITEYKITVPNKV
ncbi:DUF4304 domain-containing protein [Thalassobellus citreus]|uniref:DUF4304 domain-containing protein n=1 Tax=Thalassobellus citreus TaxID=3367752 RepID=UPI00379A155E